MLNVEAAAGDDLPSAQPPPGHGPSTPTDDGVELVQGGVTPPLVVPPVIPYLVPFVWPSGAVVGWRQNLGRPLANGEGCWHRKEIHPDHYGPDCQAHLD